MRCWRDGLLINRKAFLFVVAFIYRITSHEKAALVTWIYTRCIEINFDGKEDERHGAWGEEDFDSLKKRTKAFKRMLVQMLEEHCDTGLYTRTYHLQDHMVEDIRSFRTLSVLDSNPYKHFPVHIKPASKRNFAKETDHSEGNVKQVGEKLREGTVIHKEGG